MRKPGPAWLEVTSRVLAAFIGGYAFSYGFTACLAQLLPMPPVDAVIVASVSAFLVYAAAMLWAFACRTHWRAWAPALLGGPLALVGFWPQLMEHLA